MITDKYIFFWGGTYSQWMPSIFEIDGVQYNCAEQYMMAKKAYMFRDYDALSKIMGTTDPRKQKQFGRQVKGFDKVEWEKHCRKFVYQANYAKFTQNPKMLKELMATGDKEIVEASPEDTIWGIGMHENDPDVLDKSKWLGTNWLGIAIMEVRETLSKEYSSIESQLV